MIDFLKDCHIDDEIIEEMNKKYDVDLFDLNCNKVEIIKTINYLRDIGINNINDLLLYETDLFYKTKDDVENMFCNYDINDFISKINNNYEEIEIMF